MKPFYHLDNLGTETDSMLTCNIRLGYLDEFEPSDKLSFAFTLNEVESMDLTPEIFQATYVRKAIHELVTRCNSLGSITVCGLPSYEKENVEQTTFKYEDLPLRYTVERVKVGGGKPWSGFYFCFDVLVKGLE